MTLLVFASREPERRRPWRFSLLALLVLTTVVCLTLGIWSATRPYRVTAYLEVTSFQEFPFYNTQPLRQVSPSAIDRATRNELSLAKCQRVLASAIKSHQRESTASVNDGAGQVDDISHLYDRLSVSFLNDSKTMEMKIEGRGIGSGEDLTVLQAVVDAYVDTSTTSQIRVIQQPKLVR